ncbi:2-dehydropantoate 2-reductase [Paralimibaculum aggregatum]|uniref:2-dehydropantoate 2-reductase n=1 Tax=Paralimibaculum aggregatum TaxID=3036245 RepID=A0ABQ6LHJ8_9RHOB|nr:2-dehydropantoate 2-reductase [Limibaculum sp. NKW23]GMG82755.1 2-dehydropantoate 2-reductase [Limibaculum sp. NKW23]
MKICIFGAGAIGGYLAAGLASVEGTEVSVIARGKHLEAIRTSGLTLIKDGAETTVQVKAALDPNEIGPVDVIFNALKAHQSWESAEYLRPLMHDDTAVVCCQNGVPWWYFHGLGGAHEGRRLDAVDRGNRQWDIIGPHRAIGCSVYPAAEISGPGVIRHVYGDKFALGEPDGSASPRIRMISELLEKAGFRAPVLEDIRSELWLKLWGNLCFNPISALTRGTLDVVASHPTSRATAKAMMLEAQTIAESLGASFRVDVERRINGAAKVGKHRTSMLQDLEAGKAMEIDALVTAVQEMGRITGHPTPTLDVVLGLVQQLGMSQGLYPTYPEENDTDTAGTDAAAA